MASHHLIDTPDIVATTRPPEEQPPEEIVAAPKRLSIESDSVEMAAGAADTQSPSRRSTRARKPVQRFGQESDAGTPKEASPPAKRQRKTASPAIPKTPTKKTASTKMASPTEKASPTTKAPPMATASPAAKSPPAKALPVVKAEDVVADEVRDAAADDDDDGQDADKDGGGLHAVLTLDPDEIEDYEGWTELESDPALFNHILHKLGVSGVRCEEVLVIDEGEVMLLKQPIHGFIFLFDCDDAPEADQTVSPPEGMWFARQTIANACASVALFNILMNAEGITLGDELQRFKDETAGLIPPHRGTALAQNRFIRKIHDTFSRRLDLLDEDLCLLNQYDEYQKQKKKRKNVAKPKAKQSKKRKRKAAIDPNSAKHYVAYIHQGGNLWELDGLEEAAIDLGPAGDNWVSAVIPFIQEKINELGDQANLIALCHNEGAELKRKLAANVASVVELSKSVAAHSEWRVKGLEEVGWAADPDKVEYAATLAEMGLAIEDVNAAAADVGEGKAAAKDEAAGDEEKAGGEDVGPYKTQEEAAAAAAELIEAHVQLRAIYGDERALAQGDADTAKGRETDLTAMVHTWVELMCEADILDTTAEAVMEAAAGKK